MGKLKSPGFSNMFYGGSNSPRNNRFFDDSNGSGLTLLSLSSAPEITRIEPNRGIAQGGVRVRVLGANFQRGAQVFFGGLLALDVTWLSENEITCLTPDTGVLGNTTVVVNNPDGKNSASTGVFTGLFTYGSSGPPIVVSISRNDNPLSSAGSSFGNTVVNIIVDNSSGVTGAHVGGIALTDLTIIDAVTIQGTTGAHAAGVVDVTVTNAAGTSYALAASYTYRFDPLGISNCSVWYDADVATHVGSVLTAMTDNSGNAFDAIVSGVPAYTSSDPEFNNKPTITTVATDDLVASPGLGAGSGPITFVFVGYSLSTVAYAMSMYYAELRAPNTATWEVSRDASGTTLPATTNPSAPAVLIAVLDNAFSRLYVSSVTPVVGAVGGALDLSGFGLLIGGSLSKLFYGGLGNSIKFRDALVYDKALSQTECEYLLAGLGAENAITIA